MLVNQSNWLAATTDRGTAHRTRYAAHVEHTRFYVNVAPFEREPLLGP
jgi:hypothetical protein